MKILIKRTYMEEDCTVGFMQVILSGEYESEFVDMSTLKAHPKGGLWTTLCDTLEPHAIAWEDKPLIGQRKGVRIPGRTAIPEGTYSVMLRYSKTFKRMLPMLMGAKEFRCVTIHTGKTVEQTRGDILVGKASQETTEEGRESWLLKDSRQVFNQLYALISEAMEYGENVWVTVRSPKGWTL